MNKVDLLITNAKSIATMNDSREVILDNGWLAIQGGLIVQIGTGSTAQPEAITVVDATGCLLTPGLVNSHQHLYQNLTRSMKPNGVTGLTEWFWTYFPMWKELDEEAIRT